MNTCANEGVIKPFIVILCNKTESGLENIDGLSAYATIISNVESYKEVFNATIKNNNIRLDCGYPIIPLFSMGWDPSPRIDNHAPWCTYPDVKYASFASRDELLEAGKEFSNWIKSQEQSKIIGHILTYAWNEFEEGGYICPTYDENNCIQTDRIGTFKKITDIWKDSASETEEE